MQAQLKWTDGMAFTASAGENQITTDAKSPIGKGTGATPKELVIMGLAGCTAMDVVALMKKHKQTMTSFEVIVDVDVTQGVHPAVFTKANIKFMMAGEVDKNILIEAVQKSQNIYCGVSAMLAKAFPIFYTIELNGQEIGTGQAHFS